MFSKTFIPYYDDQNVWIGLNMHVGGNCFSIAILLFIYYILL